MTKTELLRQMRAERTRWDALMSQIPRDRMLEPAIYDGWSIKDTIGHIAFYESWMLNWLEAAVHGRVKVATHQDLLTANQRNALVWQENKDRELEELLDESRQVSERLYLLVRTLSEADLCDPHRFSRYILPFWGRTQPLCKCIAENSSEHYREHTHSVEAWWKEQKEGEALASPLANSKSSARDDRA